MSTAYLLWYGEYSDVTVVAVCSTKEKAEALMAAFPFETRIEEKPIDPPVPGADGFWPWDVIFDPDGNVAECNKSDRPWGWNDPQRATKTYFSGEPDHIGVRTRARDRDGAVKSAADLRAQLLAHPHLYAWPDFEDDE